MPGILINILLTIILTLSAVFLQAQPNNDDHTGSDKKISSISSESPAEEIWDIHGYLESENFIMYGKNKNSYWREYYFNKIEQHVNLDIRFGDDNTHVRGVAHGYLYPVDKKFNHLQNRLLANELYFRHLSSIIDLKIGRQIIRWGTADAMNPTAFFSPMDLTELFFKDEDEIFLGVDGVSFTFLPGDFSIQLVIVPIKAVTHLPSTTSPWAVRFPSIRYIYMSQVYVNPVIYHHIEPDLSPNSKNMNYGARFSGTIFEIDFSICGFHGFDNDILYYPIPDAADLSSITQIIVTPGYNIVTAVGADLALGRLFPTDLFTN